MNDVTPMPHPPPPGRGHQPDPPERLRQLWQQGHRPSVRDFLSPLGPLPPSVVASVLRIDQGYRWQSGERVPVETYLGEHPEVAADDESAVDLIYSEYLLRERSGERVALDEFLARFPRHAAVLGMQVELHQAIALCGQTEVLDPPPDDQTHHDTEAPALNPPPGAPFPQVPGYEVLAEVGRGGMGVIYKARQVGLNRVVALKMLAAPALAGAAEVARFRTEAEAVACLQHPNVVQIYEVGHQGGLSYLALEFMDRGSLAARLAGKPLAPRHAAELIETLARAVAAAHDRGIVHRDLKPANVLLATPPAGADGISALLGVPKITDFGLAKSLAEECSQTLSGTILGTPSYMAPEQAEGKTRHVGPAADVYALGAILYECLTARPPFVGVTLLETLTLVRSQEPVSPRRLRPDLPRDLVNVCLKALAKETHRRYPTALALADDLRAFRDGRPVKARPVGPGERAWRWCRRNPVVASLSAGLAALAVVLLVGLPVTAVYRSQRDVALVNLERAEKAEAETRALQNEVSIRAHLAQAAAYRRSRQEGQRFKALEEIRAAVRRRPSPELLHELRNEACAALALPDLSLEEPTLPFPPDGNSADFHPDLSVYARTNQEGTCSLRRVTDDAELYSLPGLGIPSRPYFSPDGRFLAVRHQVERLRLFRLDPGGPVQVLEEKSVHHFDFHPDGRSLALANNDGTIVLCDLDSGQPPRRLPPTTLTREVCVALHPTEPLVAVGTYNSRVVQVRDSRTGAVVADLPQPRGGGHVRWSPDGQTLAAAGGDAPLTYLYDRATWQPLRPLQASLGGELAFNRAGDRLVRSNWGGTVQMFDLGTGEKIFQPAPLWFAGLRFAGGGDRLGAAIRNDKLGCWQVGDGREVRLLVRADAPPPVYTGAAVHRDGRLLAAGMSDGFGLWDLDSGRELAFVPVGWVGHVHFEPSGSLLTTTRFGLIRWPVRAAASAAAPDRWAVGPPQFLLDGPGEAIGQSADGQVIASCCRFVGESEPYAGGWLLHAGRLSQPWRLDPGTDLTQSAVSPDGRWVVTAGHAGGPVKVWDARDGSFVKQLGKWAAGAHARFSPDGRWLATAIDGGRLFAVEGWEPGLRVGGRGTFSPRGDMVAVDTPHGVIRLVESATGRELACLDDPYGGVVSVPCFTPDGTRMITLANDRVRGLRVWDLRLLRTGLREMGLDWDGEGFPARLPGAPAQGHPSASVDIGYLHGPMLTYPDTAQSIAVFSVAVALQPLNPEGYLQRGLALGVKGQAARAREDYTRFLALAPADHPRRAEVLQRRANNHGKLKDWPAQEADLLALTRFDASAFPWPAWIAWQFNAAAWRLLLPARERTPSENALALAQKAVALEPEHPGFRTTLGLAYSRLGRYQDAVAVLERDLEALRRNPALRLHVLALCYHHLGQEVRAKESFRLAVAQEVETAPDLSERELADLRALREEVKKTLP